MRKLAVFLVAVLAVAQAPSSFQPVGNMTQLMVDVIYPTSDAIFYIERNIPQNDHDWGVLRMNALTLAESGNLLMMVPRAKDGDVWMKRSQELIDTGMAAWRAAEAKNVNQLFTVGGDIDDACSHCHQEYMDEIKNANK